MAAMGTPLVTKTGGRRSKFVLPGDSHISCEMSGKNTFTQESSEDEHYAVSKFIEAMSNPNWRTRSSQNESSELGWPSDPVKHMMPMVREDNILATSTESRSNQRSTESEDYDLIHNEPRCDHELEQDRLIPNNLSSTGLHGQRNQDHDWNDRNSHANTQGLYIVTKHRSFHHHHVRFPIHMIDVKSFSAANMGTLGGEHGYSPADLVKIERIDSSAPQQMIQDPKDDQSEQLAAALMAADVTPPRIRLRQRTQLPPALNDDNSNGFKHQYIDKNGGRESIFRNTTVEDVGCLKNGAGVLRQNHERHEMGVESSIRTPSSSDTQAAFNRMLEKLNRRQKRNKDDTKKSHSRQSAHQETAMATSSHASQQKHHANSREAGKTNSSDSGYASMDSSKCSSATTSKKNTFNPRAREFLSFKGKEMAPVIEEAQHQNFRRVAIGDLFGKYDEERKRCQSMAAINTISPIFDQTPLYQQPNSLNANEMCTGKIPAMGLPELNGFTSALTVAPGTSPCLWTPSTWPAGIWSLSQVQNYGLQTPVSVPEGGNCFSGIPLTAVVPSTLNSLQQNVMAARQGMVMPGSALQSSSATIPLTSVLPSGTSGVPVPKPRRPDPQNQQMYEAYIEWRKANEPGYAMECKMRQQRRAQRNNIAIKSVSENVAKPTAVATVKA